MTTYKLLRAVNGVAAALVAVLAVVLLAPAATAFALATSPIIGNTVRGGVGVEDVGGRLVPVVAKVIDEYEPDRTPFTTFLNNIGGLNDGLGKITNVEFEIMEMSSPQTFARVNESGGSVAGSAGATKTITVDSGHGVVPTDVLKDFGNATDATLDLLVTGATATTLTLVALPKVTSNTRGSSLSPVAFGTVPAFADDAYLQIIGSAKSEADAASDPRHMEPARTTQYIQTPDYTWYMSDHAERISVYGTRALKNDMMRRAVQEFKERRERAYLFQGEKSVTERVNLAGVVEETWKMAGLRSKLTTTVTLPDNPTDQDIVAFVYDLLPGHEGSGNQTKVALLGSDVMERIDTAAASASVLRRTRDEKVLGVSVTTLEGSKGRIALVNHPLFDAMGLANEGYVLDMKYLGRAVMQEVEERGGGEKQKEYGQMIDATKWQLISKEALVVHKATGSAPRHLRVVLGN